MDSTLSVGETALWRSVIVYAFHDATLGKISVAGNVQRRPEGWKPSSGQKEDCERARRWLLSRGQDFNLVCHFAVLDPSAVRAAAVRAIAESPDQPLVREAETCQRMFVFPDGMRPAPMPVRNFNHWKAKKAEIADCLPNWQGRAG